MLTRLTSILSLTGALALGACGDHSGDKPVDARTLDATVDARACELAGYPESVRFLEATLPEPPPPALVLDGNGTRCEQLVRVLTGPSRPAPLAELDTAGVTSTCNHDDLTNREIVRLRAPMYGGLPIYWPVQDALVHVDAANEIVFLAGNFLAAGHAPRAGCLDATALAARIPGSPLEYEKFAACTPRGPGSYAIAADDEIEVGEEGVYQDGDGGLHRVRAFDVYLKAEHVNSEITNSDAYCCSGAGVDHCVGKRLFLDALTGEVLAQEPHCHTC